MRQRGAPKGEQGAEDASPAGMRGLPTAIVDVLKERLARDDPHPVEDAHALDLVMEQEPSEQLAPIAANAGWSAQQRGAV